MADYNSKYTGSEIDSAIGKVLNNEVGGMILIPSAVLNLTPASSSSDILSAFGGEEVFKSICQNVLNGITPYIGSVNSQQRQVDVIFTNFFAIIKDNSYTLSFSQLSYIGGNYNYDFRLQGGTVTLNVKVLANTNPDALPSIAYTSNSNEGYLAIKINSTGEIRYDTSISVEANCYLLSDNNILKSYSNLGNKSIVNF